MIKLRPIWQDSTPLKAKTKAKNSIRLTCFKTPILLYHLVLTNCLITEQQQENSDGSKNKLRTMKDPFMIQPPTSGQGWI